MHRLTFLLGCFLVVAACALPKRLTPPAEPLSAVDDRVVELRSNRYGPLFVKFGDGTVGALATWSNGTLTTQWRSPFRVRDFTARDSGVCVLTTEGDVGCLPVEPRPFQTMRRVPDGERITVTLEDDACVVTRDGLTRCICGHPNSNKHRELIEGIFQSLGKLRRIIPKTHCGIDVGDRLICRGQTPAGIEEPQVLLERVEDAALEANGPYLVSGCALMKDRSVQCWGPNDHGENGQGTTGGGGERKPVPGLSNITRLARGYGRTCALEEGGAAWCFGNNFGPDFIARAREVPRCRTKVEKIEVPGCGDAEACLRAGGKRETTIVEREQIIPEEFNNPCVGPHERYVPWPTRISLFPRARDLAMSVGSVAFLRDDGVVVTVGEGNDWAEATPPPWPDPKAQ